MKTKFFAVIFAVFSLFASSAYAEQAQHHKVGDLVIMDAWARASASHKAGAAFFVVKNTGADDRLLDVKSDIAQKVEIHLSSMDANGMMKMEKQEEGVVIPAGGELILKPGSYHVMFMKLNKMMEEGATVDVELVFEKAGAVSLQIPVMKAGAMGMSHSN